MLAQAGVRITSRATSRVRFQRLALLRIREAEALYAAKCYSGAYYLAGYAVECALKAAICKGFQRHSLPERALVQKAFVHNLGELVVTAGLQRDLHDTLRSDPELAANWAVIRDWKETSRYRHNVRLNAKDLILAISGQHSPFLELIRARW